VQKGWNPAYFTGTYFKRWNEVCKMSHFSKNDEDVMESIRSIQKHQKGVESRAKV